MEGVMDLKGCRTIQIHKHGNLKAFYPEKQNSCKEVRDIEKKVNLIHSEISLLNL